MLLQFSDSLWLCNRLFFLVMYLYRNSLFRRYNGFWWLLVASVSCYIIGCIFAANYIWFDCVWLPLCLYIIRIAKPLVWYIILMGESGILYRCESESLYIIPSGILYHCAKFGILYRTKIYFWYIILCGLFGIIYRWYVADILRNPV